MEWYWSTDNGDQLQQPAPKQAGMRVSTALDGDNTYAGASVLVWAEILNSQSNSPLPPF